MEDRQRKNEAIASSIGIYNIELAHEKMEVTVPNSTELTFYYSNYYSSKMSVHIMEKKLLAVIDLINETISYLVEMTEDVEPCNIIPHGQTLFNDLYDNKEKAIDAYNELELDDKKCWQEAFTVSSINQQAITITEQTENIKETIE